jgi:hypothetical protein
MATILVMVSFAFAGLRSGPQGRAEPLAGWMRVADNVDRVADHVGGTLLALGPRGIMSVPHFGGGGKGIQ